MAIEVSVVGFDIAKNVFQVHGVDRRGAAGRWSSYRYYAYDEAGPVVVNEARRAEMRVRKIS